MKTNRIQTILVRRKLSDDLENYFLNDDEFRSAADCERMRVDRNGSVLTMLLIRLPQGPECEKEIAFLARVLEGRLRITDTAGLLDDGRVGVLLPDTPTEGAWKVAADISDVYPPGPERPECEVLVYPYEDWHMDSLSEEAAEGEPAAKVSAPLGDGTSFYQKKSPRWKRVIDVIGGSLGLLVSTPLVAAAVVAVKFSSPGPVIFTQEREGMGGKLFKIYKLRTMVHNAESLQEELREDSHQDGPAFKMKNDPRTTRVGRFLRVTSIDELPQFWNVLKGRYVARRAAAPADRGVADLHQLAAAPTRR